VVYVFATVLMLDEGLRKTLVDTGSWDTVLVIRRAAETEVQSGVDREQAAVVESQPEVGLGERGTRLVSKETVVLISLNKRGSDKPSNVVIRGVGDAAFSLRPQVKIVEGRPSVRVPRRSSPAGPSHSASQGPASESSCISASGTGPSLVCSTPAAAASTRRSGAMAIS
jgi:hypothetical protein